MPVAGGNGGKINGVIGVSTAEVPCRLALTLTVWSRPADTLCSLSPQFPPPPSFFGACVLSYLGTSLFVVIHVCLHPSPPFHVPPLCVFLPRVSVSLRGSCRCAPDCPSVFSHSSVSRHLPPLSSQPPPPHTHLIPSLCFSRVYLSMCVARK